MGLLCPLNSTTYQTRFPTIGIHMSSYQDTMLNIAYLHQQQNKQKRILLLKMLLPLLGYKLQPIRTLALEYNGPNGNTIKLSLI